MTKCQNCESIISEKFCSNCGEKRFSNEDFSYKKLFESLFTTLTDVDGKLIKSFRLFLLNPGQLTLDYFNGVRKNRINPFQIFLFSNVIYFFVLSFVWINTFNTPLNVHLTSTNFFHQELANEMVSQRLLETGLTLELYAEKFDAMTTLLSKSLVFLIIPIFSFLMYPVYFKTPRAGLKLFVFSTHFFGFILLLSISLALFVLLIINLVDIVANLDLRKVFFNEVTSSVVLLLSIGLYFFFANKRAFKDSKSFSFFRTIYMCFTLYFSILLYRSLLFFIVFYNVSN